MTEEEAKTKWCPFVRVLASIDIGPNPVAITSFNVDNKGSRHGECIGSACMAWRWACRPGSNGADGRPKDYPGDGYCGLAGEL